MKIHEYNNIHMASHVNSWIAKGDWNSINIWYKRKFMKV